MFKYANWTHMAAGIHSFLAKSSPVPTTNQLAATDYSEWLGRLHYKNRMVKIVSLEEWACCLESCQSDDPNRYFIMTIKAHHVAWAYMERVRMYVVVRILLPFSTNPWKSGAIYISRRINRFHHRISSWIRCDHVELTVYIICSYGIRHGTWTSVKTKWIMKIGWLLPCCRVCFSF